MGGRLRVGVLGYGYWGSKHVRVLSATPDVEVAVVEQDVQRLAAAGEGFPNARLFSDLGEAVGHLDAVVVATAASTHARLARFCLEAGVHALVEKPLTTDSAEALDLIRLAESRNLVLMAGHTFEYNPAVHMLRDLVTTGELGEIRYIDTARLNLGLYQADVNVIWDLAPHDISILNYLLGDRPSRVSAWAQSHVPTDVEDVAYINLEYPGDVSAYVHVSWLDPKKVRRVTVVGSEKMAVYNDVDASEPIRIYDMGVDHDYEMPVSPDRPLVYRYGEIRSPRVEGHEPLAAEDRHFVDCIRSGKAPQSDGWSGLAVVETIEAAVRSVASAGGRQGVRTDADSMIGGAA